jgi:hypothetical protein
MSAAEGTKVIIGGGIKVVGGEGGGEPWPLA